MQATPTSIVPITISHLQKMRDNNEPIAMLTCYDATFAWQMDQAGVDILLVGDSLGNVIQGQKSTVPVLIDDMVYHTKCVARAVTRAYVVADLPFGTYATKEMAYQNALQLMQAGAHMVKMEGGAWLAETVEFLRTRSIPVCAHLGLMPQSVNVLGGFKVQGRDEQGAQQLLADAKSLQNAGAQLLVLEAIPSGLGAQVTEMLTVPTIGIGAGVNCSGQVLVLYDMLGVTVGKKPKFVRDFMEGSASINESIRKYVNAVKSRVFPEKEHQYD